MKFPEIYAVHLNIGSAFMDWPRAYHRLGLVYLDKGDLRKALENLKSSSNSTRRIPKRRASRRRSSLSKRSRNSAAVPRRKKGVP